MDPGIEKLDAKLAEIEKQRAEREALLADPEYQRLRQLYVDLGAALKALDDAGEDIATPDGYDVSVYGKSFSVSGDEIAENEGRWKTYLRRKARG